MEKQRSDIKVTNVAKPIMTSMSQSLLNQITISMAKPKVLNQKNLDGYITQTIGVKNTGREVEESGIIDFILADNAAKPTKEITEELQLCDLGDDDSHEFSNADSTEEIVEHVCGKCFKAFRRISSLKKHLDFCRFDSSYHLRKAEMLKNLEKIENDAVKMETNDVCFCCGESYDTCHSGHITCPDCPKSFKTQISYERHVFLLHSEFDDHPCSICNVKLRSANLLKLHEQQHLIRGKPFACKLCGREFTTPSHLTRHQKYSSCSASNSDSISCRVCNKTFVRIDNLKTHLKQHLGTEVLKKREYTCPICKKYFFSPSTLKIHVRTHTGERPFDCDLCEKKFPSLVALRKHRRSHTGEKPYTCSVCKQHFATKEVLNRHMKRHTGDKPHVCSECGKSFIQASELRSHIKNHVRPHECEQCPEKFKTEKRLERHVKQHNIAKRKRNSALKSLTIRCDICKIRFKNKLEFNKHIKENIHRIFVERRKRKTRTDCAVCKLNFETVESLQFHILKVHQEDPETFFNENPFDNDQQQENNNTDIILMPSPKFIKIEDAQGQRFEFVTTNDKGTILNSNVQSLKQQQTLDIADNKNDEETKVITLEDGPSTSANVTKGTIFLSNEAFTVIPLETAEGDVIKSITTQNLPIIVNHDSQKRKQRNALARRFSAAIADDQAIKENKVKEQTFSKDNLELKEYVSKLLNILVDSETLKKFGWPDVTEEIILCKVIENCGHDLSKDQQNYSKYDYATRMRGYVKLLLTVVIQNDSIKELLNNYSIDEVIKSILSKDDDDDEEGDNNDTEEEDKTIKQERTYS